MSYRAPGVGSFEVTRHADNRNSEKLDAGVQVGAKRLRSPSVEEEPMKKQKEKYVAGQRCLSSSLKFTYPSDL